MARRPENDAMIQVSFNINPPKSTKYTDDMFPLDDLVIVPGYSLDSMAFGERNPNYESDAYTLSQFEQIEHDMCVPDADQKTAEKDKENKPASPKKAEESTEKPTIVLIPKREVDKENNIHVVPVTIPGSQEDDDQGVIQNLVSFGFSFYSKLFSPQ